MIALIRQDLGDAKDVDDTTEPDDEQPDVQEWKGHAKADAGNSWDVEGSGTAPEAGYEF